MTPAVIATAVLVYLTIGSVFDYIDDRRRPERCVVSKGLVAVQLITFIAGVLAGLKMIFVGPA